MYYGLERFGFVRNGRGRRVFLLGYGGVRERFWVRYIFIVLCILAFLFNSRRRWGKDVEIE